VRLQILALAGSMIIGAWVIPVGAQLPSLPQVQPTSSLSSDSENRVVNGWIYLDGRRLFQIAAPRAALPERLEQIQRNLDEISQNYLRSSANQINIQTGTLNSLPVIYVNNQYLMTVTANDAKLRQLDPSTTANQISQGLQLDLKRASVERQTQFLVQQSGIAATTGLSTIAISWGIYCYSRRSKQKSLNFLNFSSPTDSVITTELRKKQQKNLIEVRKRLFQLAQAGIWGSGTTIILGLFPYTRSLQTGILTVMTFPLRLVIVAVGTYLIIRLSYALIDRFASAFLSGVLLTPETSERLQLRVSTISGVSKSIATIVWVVVGILLALTSVGVDIIPLLAGAGLIGVAVSLASQNLIKDAINGFLIILEDQYALGDIIAVGNAQGLVENLNLRITQLRDTEGRLITIPNSEVKIVANLSSRWSRADLKIPVAYQADIDQVLKLMETVAVDMDRDPKWQEQILETPRVLGVDNFGDRGLIIRVWIKTQPLEQWNVAREFRHRLKIAFDQAGISIPFPQQAIWINDAESLKSHLDSKNR
jgi:moderate conductance mechanosensitive channel